jgi:phosphoketolase
MNDGLLSRPSRWRSTLKLPGLNFIYAHLNRVTKRHDLDVIVLAGHGHGWPSVVATLSG